jgi:Icc protein
MTVHIENAELFGITESSLTLYFAVEADGEPIDAPAQVRVDGEIRSVSEGTAGTRKVEIDGLEPDTEYRLDIETNDGSKAAHDDPFPAVARTLPNPSGELVASFATLNDLHFGEPRFGGVLGPDGEPVEDRAGWEFVLETDTKVPYWKFMNDDAIAEINALDVDATFIKGDIADRGLPEQFAAAADAFSKFDKPHHAFLGNHDYYARNLPDRGPDGREVDGYALLGQPPAPRSVDLGGWRLVLLETAMPGDHHGEFDDERLHWLDETLSQSREAAMPTLVMMHHQPVPPEHAGSYPNTIGIKPNDSMALFELLGANPQVRGVLIGHTHRNRVRRYAGSGSVPFIEINCTKDYPGGFGHYRLFDDGSFRQQVHRTSTARALAHSTRCATFFQHGYRKFALGALSARSFAVGI